jgi:hypothetical protein
MEVVPKVIRSVGSCVWFAKRVNRQISKPVEQHTLIGRLVRSHPAVAGQDLTKLWLPIYETASMWMPTLQTLTNKGISSNLVRLAVSSMPEEDNEKEACFFRIGLCCFFAASGISSQVA